MTDLESLRQRSSQRTILAAAKLPVYNVGSEPSGMPEWGKMVVTGIAILAVGAFTIPSFVQTTKTAVQIQQSKADLQANGFFELSDEDAMKLLPSAVVRVRVINGKRTAIVADYSIEDLNKLRQQGSDARGSVLVTASGKLIQIKADGTVYQGMVPLEAASKQIQRNADLAGWQETDLGGKQWLQQKRGEN